VSLDGFIAGPNDGLELPLGERGEELHEWVYGLVSWRERHGLAGGESGPDAEILDEAFKDAGAVDRDISIAGGANTVQQYLDAGLLDELQIHLVPLMLGGGVRLFDQADPERIGLEPMRVVESPRVTHLK